MNTYAILKLIFIILMAIASLCFGFGIVKYIRDYKILQFIFAKIQGKAAEADRIRRAQMKESFKAMENITTDINKKPTLIDKLYRSISMTGVTSVLPGFSESAFLIVFCVIGVIIFTFFMIKSNFLVALVALGGYIVIAFYILSIATYTRRIKMESQLLDFVNMVATASRQYSNIADILGATYEEFQQPLSGAMENCYIESKQLKNTELAIKHMKDKFDSVQLSFVIDNLLLCSNATGNYSSVAEDLSKTVSIYITSHEKKQAILRNAKVTLAILFVLGMVACYVLGIFVGGIDQLFNNTGGQIIAVLLVVLFFYGMNMKAE